MRIIINEFHPKNSNYLFVLVLCYYTHCACTTNRHRPQKQCTPYTHKNFYAECALQCQNNNYLVEWNFYDEQVGSHRPIFAASKKKNIYEWIWMSAAVSRHWALNCNPKTNIFISKLISDIDDIIISWIQKINRLGLQVQPYPYIYSYMSIWLIISIGMLFCLFIGSIQFNGQFSWFKFQR